MVCLYSTIKMMHGPINIISIKLFIRYDLKMRMQVFLLRRGVLNSPNRFPVPCGTLNLADVCNQNRGRP